METVIIGEIGACHDGRLDKALEMVRDVAAVGADYAKGQFWSSADRLAERRRSGDQYRDIYRHYQMPEAWLPVLKAECDANGIGWMCTSYLPEDIAVVEPYVDHFKVASFEAADLDFIRAHYRFTQNSNRWLIVSTGLQGDDTLEPLMAERVLEPSLKLLHCVSAYPAPPESLALRQIQSMRFDGFSDHAASEWIASGAVAVALGAKILEVHIRPATMDEQNPDAPHALLPGQFRRYVEHVRLAEAAIGEEPWRRHNPAEDAMRQYKVQP